MAGGCESALAISGMVAVFVHSTCLRKFDITLPETNIAPENGWLEHYVIFGIAYLQVLCSFQGLYGAISSLGCASFVS